MNMRCHQRVKVQNLAARLSYGIECYKVTVSDICRNGLLLTGSPGFKGKDKVFSINICSSSRNFTLQVEVKWVDENNSGRKMGLEILNPTFDWNLFVMIYEPADEDIWTLAPSSI